LNTGKIFFEKILLVHIAGKPRAARILEDKQFGVTNNCFVASIKGLLVGYFRVGLLKYRLGNAFRRKKN